MMVVKQVKIYEFFENQFCLRFRLHNRKDNFANLNTKIILFYYYHSGKETEGKTTRCKIKGTSRYTYIIKLDFLSWSFLQILEENTINVLVKLVTKAPF